MRRARVKFNRELLPGKVCVSVCLLATHTHSLTHAHTHSHTHTQLVDLPTIIESYKTLDSKNLYKTGDVSQMLVCANDPDTYVPPVKGSSVEDMTALRKKELYKTFTSNHGSTLCVCGGGGCVCVCE